MAFCLDLAPDHLRKILGSSIHTSPCLFSYDNKFCTVESSIAFCIMQLAGTVSILIACAKFGLNPKAKIPQERQNSERALHVPLLLFISGRIKDRIQSCAGAHSAVHIHCTCVSPYTNEPQAPFKGEAPVHTIRTGVPMARRELQPPRRALLLRCPGWAGRVKIFGTELKSQCCTHIFLHMQLQIVVGIPSKTSIRNFWASNQDQTAPRFS